MILYNPNFLDNVSVFSVQEKKELENLSNSISLSEFLSNKSYIDKFGLDFIYTSAKIEGNTYTKLDTQALIDYGRTAGGKKYTDAKMILNMKEAYENIICNNLKANKGTLKNLHYILSNEMIPENQRAVPRDSEVLIKASSYIPLSTQERLNDELNYMFSQYNDINNPFDRAVYLHCNLSYLQYFQDCNKRTARILLNVSLKDDDKMLYIPHEERIGEYLESIVTYYETGSYSKFKSYFIDEYRETIETILEVKKAKEKEMLFSRDTNSVSVEEEVAPVK